MRIVPIVVKCKKCKVMVLMITVSVDEDGKLICNGWCWYCGVETIRETSVEELTKRKEDKPNVLPIHF